MAVLTIFSVITRILGFVFKIILSRAITPEQLGVYTIVLSIFFVFITAISSGMPVTVSKRVAENMVGNKHKQNHQIVTSSLIISLAISAIAIVFLVFSKGIIQSVVGDINAYYLLLALIPAVVATAVYVPFRGYLWGQERYLKVSMVEFVEQLLRIGTCVLLFFVLTQQHYLVATGIALSVACVLSTGLGLWYYYKSKGKLNYNKQVTMPLLKSSSTITFVRLAGSLMSPFLVILIPIKLEQVGFTQQQALSQLGVAMGMAMPLLSIPSTIIGALATALIPRISSLVKEQKKGLLISQINSAIIFTMVCTIITLPVFIALGPQIAMLVFNNQTAGEYIQNASWLVVTMCMSQLTTSILNSLGLETKTFIYYIISSVFLLLCVFILPQYVGIYALLYGLGISSAIVTVLNIIKINKTIRSKKTFIKELLVLSAICVPTVMLTTYCYNIFILIFPSIVAIGLAAIIALVAFFAVLTTSGMVNIEFFASNLKPKRKQKLKVPEVKPL